MTGQVQQSFLSHSSQREPISKTNKDHGIFNGRFVHTIISALGGIVNRLQYLFTITMTNHEDFLTIEDMKNKVKAICIKNHLTLNEGESTENLLCLKITSKKQEFKMYYDRSAHALESDPKKFRLFLLSLYGDGGSRYSGFYHFERFFYDLEHSQ